jgi:hypothetical protein
MVADLGELMERVPMAIDIGDAKLLPHPKYRLLAAITLLLRTTNDERARGFLAGC